MRALLGATQNVLIRGVSLFQGCLIYIRYIWNCTQSQRYSECLYFRGVHKEGPHCISKSYMHDFQATIVLIGPPLLVANAITAVQLREPLLYYCVENGVLIVLICVCVV